MIHLIYLIKSHPLAGQAGIEPATLRLLAAALPTELLALINLLKKDDIVITQDYGLAAMAINKASYVINQNGLIYSNENIDRLLYSRHISKKIRKSGGRTKGPKKRTKEDDLNFERILTEICDKLTY